jgi:hypothetical protein
VSRAQEPARASKKSKQIQSHREDAKSAKARGIEQVHPLSWRSKSGSWRNSIGTVHDTPAFREMIAAGRAIRESDMERSANRIDQDDV